MLLDIDHAQKLKVHKLVLDQLKDEGYQIIDHLYDEGMRGHSPERAAWTEVKW